MFLSIREGQNKKHHFDDRKKRSVSKFHWNLRNTSSLKIWYKFF